MVMSFNVYFTTYDLIIVPARSSTTPPPSPPLPNLFLPATDKAMNLLTVVEDKPGDGEHTGQADTQQQ